MGSCGSCSTGGCGSSKPIAGTSGTTTKTAGCQSSGGCGCNKMNNFDWLGNMDLPGYQRFEIMEVKFKGGRKEFFRNTAQLDLHTGDAVIVDMNTGSHLGYVSMQGELVRLQMLKKGVKEQDDLRPILRKAGDKDLDRFAEIQKRDLPTLFRTRQIIQEMKLNMKLSDVEFQADNSKATFYYSAEDRVDFRELIKVLASEFKVRVEMRQISLRQEAGRIGGIGSCGRELCCSTWLTDFKNVATSAARYQNLSLNPTKLSGQCGRLKCCLNYELETYMDALMDIPKVEGGIMTERGKAVIQKVDIFKKILWFSYADETTWHPISAERARELVDMNKKGEIPPGLLAEDQAPAERKKGESPLNEDLDSMDQRFRQRAQSQQKKKNKDKDKARPPQPSANAKSNPRPPKPEGKGPRPEQPKRQGPPPPKEEAGREQQAPKPPQQQRPEQVRPPQPPRPPRPPQGDQPRQDAPKHDQGRNEAGRKDQPKQPPRPPRQQPPQQPEANRPPKPPRPPQQPVTPPNANIHPKQPPQQDRNQNRWKNKRNKPPQGGDGGGDA